MAHVSFQPSRSMVCFRAVTDFTNRRFQTVLTLADSPLHSIAWLITESVLVELMFAAVVVVTLTTSIITCMSRVQSLRLGLLVKVGRSSVGVVGNTDLVSGYNIALHMRVVPATPRCPSKLMGPLTTDCASNQLHLHAIVGDVHCRHGPSTSV